MSSPSVGGEPCIFCREPSSRRGEHALPHAALRRLFPSGDGPFTTSKNGTDLREDESVDRPKVPCCDDSTNPSGQGCNAKLARRFEDGAQSLSLDLWEAAFRSSCQSGEALSVDEVHPAGRWFLKSLLLLFHPERIEWFDRIQDPERRLSDAPTLWRWMVDDQLPEPDDVHLWVTAAPEDDPIEVDRGLFAWEEPGLGQVQQRLIELEIAGLRFTLLYHVGANLRLPESPGVQFWPASGSAISWDQLCAPSRSLRAIAAPLSRLRLADGEGFIQSPFELPRPFTDPPGGVGGTIA